MTAKYYLLILTVSLTLLSCGRDKTPEEQARDSVREVIVRDSSELAAIPEPDTSGTGRWTANTRSGRRDIWEASLLGDIRTSTNPTYDRIVFVFRTAQIPNWKIGYVDKNITSCGSGEPVTVAGKAWLEIRLEPCNAHDTLGHPTLPWREKQFTHRSLEEMKLTCDFEAVTTLVAGLKGAKAYRVLELKDPARLVIDVANN